MIDEMQQREKSVGSQGDVFHAYTSELIWTTFDKTE